MRFICSMVSPGDGRSPITSASSKHVPEGRAQRLPGREEIGELEAESRAAPRLGGGLFADPAQRGRRLVVLGLPVRQQVLERLAHQPRADGALEDLAVVVAHGALEIGRPAARHLVAPVAEDEREVGHGSLPRAMRAAVTPAPTPLSMLTTTRPGEQLCSMASSAASPLPPMP